MMDDTIVGETVSEAIAETLPVADSVTKVANLWGIEMHVVLCLLLIDLIIAVSVYFFSTKLKGDLSKLVCALASPATALFAILFGGDDDYRIRIVIIALILVGYYAFYFLTKIAFTYFNKKNVSLENATNKKIKLSVVLPIGKEHIIDNRFIEELPANVSALVHISEEIRILTNEFINSFNSFSSLDDDKKRHETLNGYFLGMCYYLAALFSFDTRAHVRILKDSKYQRFISTYAQYYPPVEDKQSMKDMSFDNKMISRSFSERCSLIKILNPELHEDGSNNKWKNYLMFALPQITHDNKPVFTMGISVTRKIEERFYFLNYCTIEAIVGSYFDSIIEKTDGGFSEFIERYYFPQGN